ncbi:DUF120 domain-containing protein [archaeon]
MSLLLKGRVVSGDKTGAYFISMYAAKMKAKLGYDPFPGTLNLELPEAPSFPTRSHFISSWTEDGKSHGAVWMYPAVMLNTRVTAVVPELTHHGSKVVEVISPYCLRTKFGLKDGDYIDLEVEEVTK